MPSLPNLGAWLLEWFLAMNLWTAAVLGAVLVADRLLSRHVAARWRLWLYAAVVLRVCLPVDWESPLGMLHATVPEVVLETRSFFVAADSIPDRTTAAIASAGTVSSPAGWLALVPLAYLLGVLLLTLRYWRARRALGRALLTAESARPAVRAHVSRRRVFEHPFLGPLATRLGGPRIVLPRSLVERADVVTLRSILRHEEAHLDRGDPQTLALAQGLVVLLWPLLPLWLALVCVRRRMEEACDASVLAHGRDIGVEQYGDALLMAVHWLPPRPVRPALPFAGELERRFKAMQVSRSGARVPQLCIVLTLIALITGCASMAPRATFEEWSQWESSPVPDTWEVEGDETLYDVRVRVFDVEANLLERVVTREGIGELEEFPAPRGDGVARSARITPRQTEHLLRALWRTREANLALSPRLAVLDGQKASCWVGHAPTDAPDAHIGQLWEFEVNGESNGVRLGFGYGIGSQENADYLHRGEHDLAPNEVLLVMLPTPASPEEQFLTPASCVLVTVVPFAP